MKHLRTFVVAGALASLTAVAVAQNAAPAPEAPAAAKAEQPRQNGRLARLDTNKDGSVTADEFASAQRFKDADTNNDGTLSNDELVAMVMKRQAERQAERMTRRLDINGDGKVTIAEIEQQRAKEFAAMDRNNDGKLERRELRRGDRQFRGNDRHEGRKWHRHGGGKHHDREWRRHERGGPDRGEPMPDRT